MYISIYIYVLQMKFEKFTRCDAENYQKYRAEVVYYQIPSNSRAKRVPSNFLSRAPSNLIEISRERGRIGLSNGRSFYRPRSLSLPITKKIPLDNPRSKPENYPLFSPFLPSPLRVSGFEDRPKCISLQFRKQLHEIPEKIIDTKPLHWTRGSVHAPQCRTFETSCLAYEPCVPLFPRFFSFSSNFVRCLEKPPRGATSVS